MDNISYMDGELFKAAKDGDMEVLFNKYKGGLDRLLDGQQNTALHVYSTSGGRQVIKKECRSLFSSYTTRSEKEVSINYLEQLLDRCPSLLLQGNARGEIPLHLAARHGNSEIVEFLIKRSKEQYGDLEQMLRMTDKDQNTALHKAVQYFDNLQVVRLLLKEDPTLSNSVNTSGVTPLYLAARRGFFRSVAEILDANCKPMALVGPHGRTILHAAALGGSEQTVKIILERKKHLTKEGDEDGWTPLHYAAHRGHYLLVEALLENDGSAAAYLTDKERGISPLHLAALQGDIDMMRCIISHCPGCVGIVDKRGWNFLHFANVTLHPPYFAYDNRFILNVNDDKDVNGITPFHVARYGPHSSKYSSRPVWDENSSQVAENKVIIYGFSILCKKIEEVLKEISNIEVAGIPVRGFSNTLAATTKGKNNHSTDSYNEREEKIRQTHLLVATLVATVTFTAAFTVPGGYKSDKGTAILSRNTAFNVFVISNSLAFVSSLSAVYTHILISGEKHSTKCYRLFYHMVDPLTGFGMMAMAMAFSTGLYAVLETSLGLAIAACSIGNLFFLIISYAYYKGYGVYLVYENLKWLFTDNFLSVWKSSI
ncbi:hypothetical protein CCACVL1_21135 [Corchorus capsularis]|uniref:PGG domain-containing protein n=1 Tax=Corchorus capsularis TaxID=210143 RepID=A0A1R3H7W5_COCAP|nr:hypothetical protein CCACVL1_21135 [Corchorus capsularis]